MSNEQKRRVDQLECLKEPKDKNSRVIILCGPGGDPKAALTIGGKSYSRNEKETDDEFLERVQIDYFGTLEGTTVVLPAKRPEPR